MSSSIDPTIPPLHPSFKPTTSKASPNHESPFLSALIQHLSLQPHPEGGYFVETDRDHLKVPAPWETSKTSNDPSSSSAATHNASTTIHYLLTPTTPLGHFHRNRARTIHTLHRGRGRYVIIHADEVASSSNPGGYPSSSDPELPESQLWTGKARIETFIVGQDVLKGERVQWIVEGGKYKCSFLLPDKDGEEGSEGLLISETVVPGFEFGDHDFLTGERLRVLVEEGQAEEIRWMVRKK